MSRQEKLLLAILSGTQDKNISFSDLQSVLDRLGFVCRIKGDQLIYTLKMVSRRSSISSRLRK